MYSEDEQDQHSREPQLQAGNGDQDVDSASDSDHESSSHQAQSSLHVQTAETQPLISQANSISEGNCRIDRSLPSSPIHSEGRKEHVAPNTSPEADSKGEREDLHSMLVVKIEAEEGFASIQSKNSENDLERRDMTTENRVVELEDERDPIWSHFQQIGVRWKCKKCKLKVTAKPNVLRAHYETCSRPRKRGRPKGSTATSKGRQFPFARHRPVQPKYPNPKEAFSLRKRRPAQMYTSKQCLLCGDEVHNLSSSNSKYRLWAESCANSMCELLNLDHSFLHLFLNADYCESCTELCRDTDFTLKALSNLQQRLNNTRQSVESLLKVNYEGIASEAKNVSFSFLSNINSYDHIVKTIYDALFLTPEQLPVIISVRGGGHLKRKYKKRPTVVETAGLEAEEAGRGKRARSTVLSVTDSGILNNDPDFGLDIDNEGENDYPAEEWLPPDDSNDDEDWREARRKKKKSNSKPKLKVKKVVVEHETNRGEGEESYKYKCSYNKCVFSSSKAFNLDVHIRQKHLGSKTPYHCKHCEKQFRTYEILTYHMKRHSAAKISCPVANCTRKFYEATTLRKHVAWKHHMHDRLICTYCSKTFDQKEENELKAHTALHETEAIPFSCVLFSCHFTPTNSLDLKKHVAHEHEEKTICCEICPGKLFSSYNSLKSHRQKEHAPGASEGFKCPRQDCTYVGSKKSDLVRHAVSHVTERIFQCETCGNSYKNKGSLTRHIMTHTGIAPYKCKICSKSFNMGHKLKNHEEIHSPIKSYVCHKCGKAFRALKNLQQHSTYHCFSDGAERPKAPKRNKRAPKTHTPGSEGRAEPPRQHERHRSGNEDAESEPTNSSHPDPIALSPSQLACIATYTDTMNNERISIPIMRGPPSAPYEIPLPQHPRNWAAQQQQFHHAHPNTFLGQSFSTLDLSQASTFMPSSSSSSSQFGMLPNQSHWNV